MVLSIVSLVTAVQFVNPPLVKSSAKIAEDPDWTTIGSEAGLLELVLAVGVAESTASTSYVWLVPFVSPTSVNVVLCVCVTALVSPSR